MAAGADHFSGRPKYLDHLNPAWLAEPNFSLADRESVFALYQRLLTNQELSPAPPGFNDHAHQSGYPPRVTRGGVGFYEPPGAEERGVYVEGLQVEQRVLAHEVCRGTGFAQACGARLAVLHRVFHAVRSAAAHVQCADSAGT